MGYFSPIIREHLSNVQSQIHGDMLDVGCGDKPYRDIFQNITSYTGCDYLTITKEVGAVNKARLHSVDVIADASFLPFHSGSFDAVLSTQLIEHLQNPWLFFSEVGRILRPSGLFIITFPLFNPIHEEPYDFFRFTEFGVGEMCSRSNMAIKQVVKMGGGWLTVGYLMRHFLYKSSGKHTALFWKKLLFLCGSLVYGFMRRLDKYNQQDDSPLNYLVIAQKKTK